MGRFIDSIRNRWVYGGMLTRLVLINVGVFLLLRIAVIIITLAGGNAELAIMQWIELPSLPYQLLIRPWTLLTYMFAHYSILHILFNMLWLWWFGQMFLVLGTPRQLVALYIYGGIGGAILYMTAFACLPYFAGVHGMMLGASASVLAIVVATAWRMPEYKVGLLFLGEVSIKWIAGFTVLLSLLRITGENAGGNIAHIGGALVGMAYGLCMMKGVDITRPLNRLIDGVVNAGKSVSAPKVKKPRAERYKGDSQRVGGERTTSMGQGGLTRDDQDRMNAILDKIKKSGYSALTAEERRILFDVSKRVK